MADGVSIESWFDPMNCEHVRAFGKVLATATWPVEDVPLPENVTTSPGWSFRISGKLARAWVDNFDTLVEALNSEKEGL